MYDVMLIDGNNMAHRARHAYNLSFKGQDTSVIYGTLRMIMALVKEYKPKSLVMCWDGGTPEYRKRFMPMYKANRTHDDGYEVFLYQMHVLHDIIPSFGIVQLRRSGIEADDLLYHACRMLSGYRLIVSGDEDMFQAVGTGAHILKPGKVNVVVTRHNFAEITGVEVEYFVMAKTLAGDSSDNIPGVRGIGMLTATKILEHADNIEMPGEVDPAPFTAPVPETCGKHQAAIEMFIGSTLYERTYKVFYLADDRCGARYEVANATWQPFDRDVVYTQCFKHGFASLTQSDSLEVLFGSLQPPELKSEAIRTPMIWDYNKETS